MNIKEIYNDFCGGNISNDNDKLDKHARIQHVESMYAMEWQTHSTYISMLKCLFVLLGFIKILFS